MRLILFSGLVALIISFLAAPVARLVAIRFGVFASPNHRTVHRKLTPKLGGLGIFVAFLTGLYVLTLLDPDIRIPWELVLAGGLVMLVGLLDDIYHLSCYRKLLGQSFAALVAVYFGFRMDTLYLPLAGTIELTYWAVPASILWIVFITNAVNLLDGLDGLACGFTVVVSLCILACALTVQNVQIASTSLILGLAALGFLKHNFTRARIFLGDTGSLFLGFALACLSIKAFSTPTTGSHLLVLVVLLWVPVTDTALSIFRRMSLGKHPFTADKKHVHHRLLELGLSQTKTVLSIYTVTLLSGLSSVAMFLADDLLYALLFVIAALLTLYGFYNLGCFDFLQQRSNSRHWLRSRDAKRLEALWK